MLGPLINPTTVALSSDFVFVLSHGYFSEMDSNRGFVFSDKLDKKNRITTMCRSQVLKVSDQKAIFIGQSDKYVDLIEFNFE